MSDLKDAARGESRSSRRHRFSARLRGVEVLCTVSFDCANTPTVRVETRADSLSQGLRSVSRFAGYCERSLLLANGSDGDVAWASVMASYYGFGLAVESGAAREEIMPPPDEVSTESSAARGRFVQRVLAQLPERG